MARMRFMAVALLALALAGNSTQTGRTQTDRSPVQINSQGGLAGYSSAGSSDDYSCVIYSLNEMGYDADLGTWIAQTIPVMIEPQKWKESGGSGVLRYYAAKNILVVNQSAAVRSKVDDFLKKLKTSLPKTSHTKSTKSVANKKSSHASVVPAEYQAPAPMRTANPYSETTSYPVPAPVKAPKHLFHFLIRYEGEGIIDDNVVKMMKVYGQSMKEGTSQAPVQATAQGSPNPTVGSAVGSAITAGGSLSSPSSAPSVLPPSVADPVKQPKKPVDTEDTLKSEDLPSAAPAAKQKKPADKEDDGEKPKASDKEVR